MFTEEGHPDQKNRSNLLDAIWSSNARSGNGRTQMPAVAVRNCMANTAFSRILAGDEYFTKSLTANARE